MNSLETLVLTSVCATLAITAGCGGGSAATSSGNAGSTPPADSSTPGLYKGTITSTSTGQATGVFAMVGPDGQTAWMSTDGRTWTGTMPMTGTRFDLDMMGRMYAGATFPDGSNAGPWAMRVDHHAGQMSGHFAGAGDAGSFSLMLSSMWRRAASLQALAGVYTRSTWSGYTMTMTVGADGHVTAADSRGCSIDGTVAVPDPARNLYAIAATVTSCGALDGTYQGHGTLVDADAMRDWMGAMHPLEQGGHTHGAMGGMGGGMGGMGGMTYNTVPGGTSNLFMFVLANEENAIMDALAR